MYKSFIRNQLQLSMKISWREMSDFLNFDLPKSWHHVTEPVNDTDEKHPRFPEAGACHSKQIRERLSISPREEMPRCLLLEGYFSWCYLFSLRAFSIPEYHHCRLAHSFSRIRGQRGTRRLVTNTSSIVSYFLRWSFLWYMWIN